MIIAAPPAAVMSISSIQLMVIREVVIAFLSWLSAFIMLKENSRCIRKEPVTNPYAIQNDAVNLLTPFISAGVIKQIN